ncbi:MAG: hydroxymethylbilane synthase [Parachlamydiaceae bacterium]|nr:hydroxymethylbilane synthase [Parachlamydiaceae bacterium]
MGGNIMILIAAARSSPLSQVQLVEVQEEINKHHPDLSLQPLFIDTTGDKDLKTSLRGLGRSDFFTQQIDAALLQRRCSIAIHSAKDLPVPLDEGLTVAAITEGKDHRDSLVLRDGFTLETLPPGSLIATSSERREEIIRSIRDDLVFADLRGTIGQRLDLLESGKVDGVVIAEAALIRLNLTHLNRFYLPGETTPLQGKLAIVVRRDAHALLELFSCIDSRQKCHGDDSLSSALMQPETGHLIPS